MSERVTPELFSDMKFGSGNFTYEERSRRSSVSDALTTAGKFPEHSGEGWRHGRAPISSLCIFWRFSCSRGHSQTFYWGAGRKSSGATLVFSHTAPPEKSGKMSGLQYMSRSSFALSLHHTTKFDKHTL